MPKRGHGDDDGSVDPPDVIQGRRKAKLSPRFRMNGASTGTEGAAAPAAFAGLVTAPSAPGFVFGSVGGGSGTAGFKPNTPSPPALTFGAPSRGFPVAGGAGNSSPAGFPFLTASAPPSKPATTFPPSKLPPLAFSTSPSTAAVMKLQPDSQPAAVSSAFTVQAADAADGVGTNSQPSSLAPARVAPRLVGPAFGRGTTAVQGARLNKRFLGWLSHHLQANPAARLEAGLRDYTAFAAQIRYRVELYTDERAPKNTVAFKHSPDSPAAAGSGLEGPVLAVASNTKSDHGSASKPSKATSAPSPPAAAPAPTPTFSFGSPSTLPPASAPSSKFSFTMPTASAKPPAVAALAASPARGGFNFNSAGFGAPAPPAKSPFKGFQIPGGGAMAPPAPAADAEEDSMPKEDPSKLERAQGEEQEQIVHEVRSKLYKFKKDEVAWGDMGVGVLRLMKHNTTDARRLVLRNDMGKVLLNVGLYKGMKVTVTKDRINFVANVEDAGPTSLMVKVKADEVSLLHTKLLEELPST